MLHIKVEHRISAMTVYIMQPSPRALVPAKGRISLTGGHYISNPSKAHIERVPLLEAKDLEEWYDSLVQTIDVILMFYCVLHPADPRLHTDAQLQSFHKVCG